MAIQAIFFDTTDTLYSSAGLEKVHKKQPLLQLSELRNISFEEAEKIFADKKNELKEKLDHVTKVAVMMELGISRLEMQEYMARIDANDFLQADPKLNDLLEKISRDYFLGIISNILGKAVQNVLAALSIDPQFFTYFVTVDNTSKSKPDPEPFQKAIELAGCTPQECVYVGDSLTKDMIPAKKEGMKTVWITQENVIDKHVDEKITNLYDLENVLQRLS